MKQVRGRTQGLDHPEEPAVYRDEFDCAWEGPFPFTLASIQGRAPREEGVYLVLYGDDEDAVVAYVGVASGHTIRGQLREHAAGRGNWALGRLADGADFWFVCYPSDDPAECEQIKSHVLLTRNPPFNAAVEYEKLLETSMVS